MADWASLPHELLVVIVEFVKKIPDLAAFGTVCKAWHAAATKDRFKELLFREWTPYLMLPVRDGDTRDLYSLSEGEVVDSVRVPNLSERKCYESLGWLLAVDKDGSVCLFDPFSRTEIPLPDLNTLPYFSGCDHNVFVKKMVLSARPTDPSDPSNFVVALIFRIIIQVAFWKPGDKFWHLTLSGIGHAHFEDITYHAGNYYLFDQRCQVTSFNILNGFPKQGQVITSSRPDPLFCSGRNMYIVKMSGSLLLVTRAFSLGSRTKRFNVYEFHISSNTWTKINNLGNIALFLGSDIATTIVDSSRFPGTVKANHIYFTDDGIRNPFEEVGEPHRAVTGEDMGVYNLGNERIDPIYHGKAFKSKISHPAWIFPFLWSLPADEMRTL